MLARCRVAAARAGILVLLCWTFAVDGEAQRRTLSLVQGCPACGIQVETLLTLDSRADSHALVPSVQGLTLDAQGRVWMSVGPQGPVHVFGVDGHLEGTLGRRGPGPGEFTAPMGVVAFADSVAVFDPGSGLASIYGMDLGFVRSVRIPGQIFRGVAGEGSIVIVNGILPTPESVGAPFHVLDLSTGSVVRSFGGDPRGGSSPGDAPLLVAFLDRDPISGEVWTALRHRPLLQRWSATGDHLENVELSLPWFPEGGRASLGSPSTPPDPAISGLFHDGRHLWVAFQLPHPDWRRAWPAGPAAPSTHPGQGAAQGGWPDREALFTGRMLVLDADGSRIVGAWDMDLLPSLSATPSGALARLRDPGGLYPALEIVRPVLRGQRDP